jgi:PKHD-type hydroxylase
MDRTQRQALTELRPTLFGDVLSRPRCEELRARFAAGVPRPRSYQGVVDAELRKCTFEALEWADVPEFERLVAQRVEPTFGIALRIEPASPVMLYRYGPGVGFVPHHDEVTEVEVEHAQTNGQPVMGGDITIVAFLNDADEYGGGELFFPDIDASFKPEAGTATVFPATRDFIHGVARVRHGERFTCVARCYLARDEVDRAPRRDQPARHPRGRRGATAGG